MGATHNNNNSIDNDNGEGGEGNVVDKSRILCDVDEDENIKTPLQMLVQMLINIMVAKSI